MEARIGSVRRQTIQQLEDITGIKVTVCHEDTLHMLNEAIMIYGETRGSPVVILEDAISKDPDFLFAQLFLVSLNGVGVSTYDLNRRNNHPTVPPTVSLMTHCILIR